MKRLVVGAALVGVLVMPGMARAGSSSDAALALGAFAVFNQILSGTGVFGGVREPVVAAPPVVYTPAPPPAVVYSPAPPPVYAPAPPPQVVYPAPPPQVVYPAPPPAVVYPAPPAVVYRSPAVVYGGHWHRHRDWR